MAGIIDLDRGENAVWDAFVDRSPQGIIYCHSWWLEAVAPGRFELLAVRNGEEIHAGWPIVWAEDGHRQRVVMPRLTQKLGILFAPRDAKYAEDLANQHRMIEELIGQLPPGVTIDQNFHENFTNWLPFYWQGYQQTCRYTYILDDLSDTEAIWNGMRNTMRTEIRKAQKWGLRVVETDDLEYFYNVNTKTFTRQGMEPPHRLEFMQRIDEACTKHAGRKIIIAEGPDGRAHAAIYLVYDPRCTILLLSGGDEELRGSGAGPLLNWESIRFAATVSQRFDFEGSMIRPIESHYRGFGGRQTPYFRIWGSAVQPPQSRLRHWLGRALRKAARIVEP